MSREKGHALRREQEAGTAKSRWACECGRTFGQLGVHAARKVWREHKDGLTDVPAIIDDPSEVA